MIQQEQSLKITLRITQEYLQWSEKAIKVLFPFLTAELCDAGSTSYIATKTIYCNRLSTEAVMRTQLSSVKPGTKEFKMMVFFSLFFILQNISIFHFAMKFMLTCNAFIIIL